MKFPVACRDIRIADGVARRDHHAAPDVDAHMGNAGGVVGSFKENQIAGFRFGCWNRGTNVVKALRPEPPHVPAAVIDYPAHIAGAVERGFRAGTAPHIRVAEIFCRFLHHGGEGFVRHVFCGYVIICVLFEGGSVEIEKTLEDQTSEKRKQERLKQEKPVLDAFWSWVDSIKDGILQSPNLVRPFAMPGTTRKT